MQRWERNSGIWCYPSGKEQQAGKLWVWYHVQPGSCRSSCSSYFNRRRDCKRKRGCRSSWRHLWKSGWRQCESICTWYSCSCSFPGRFWKRGSKNGGTAEKIRRVRWRCSKLDGCHLWDVWWLLWSRTEHSFWRWRFRQADSCRRYVQAGKWCFLAGCKYPL